MSVAVDPDHLSGKLRSRNAVIGIAGLGYVGLPLALTAAKAGFRVLGMDIDPRRVAALNSGHSGIRHVPDDAIRRYVNERRFAASDQAEHLADADAILICVPTPLARHREGAAAWPTSSSSPARSARACRMSWLTGLPKRWIGSATVA